MSTDLAGRFADLDPAGRREFLRRVGLGGAREGVARLPRTEWPVRGPVSPGQEALWLLWRMAPRSPDYNVPQCYDIAGPLRPEALAAAVDGLAARHEILRTTFAESEGEPLQVVHAGLADVLKTGEAPDRDAALAAARRAAGRPFDLRRGPLIRARLWRYAPDRHLLLIVCHHIVLDERSSRILEDELSALYRSAAPLPELPCQFVDVAAAARRRDHSASLAYWSGHLTGSQGTELPPDRPRPETPTRSGDTLELELPDHAAGAADALADGRGVTGFMVAAAAFAVFLAERTGRTDVVFGTAVAGRGPESERLIGYFLNMVALRYRLRPEWTFDQLVRESRDVVAAAMRHTDAPFQEVVRTLGRPRDPSRSPLFDVVFVHLTEDRTAGGAVLSEDLDMRPVSVLPEGASFDLTVALVEDARRPVLALRYTTDLYERATVRRWGEGLIDLLGRLRAEPTVPLARILSR